MQSSHVTVKNLNKGLFTSCHSFSRNKYKTNNKIKEDSNARCVSRMATKPRLRTRMYMFLCQKHKE